MRHAVLRFFLVQLGLDMAIFKLATVILSV